MTDQPASPDEAAHLAATLRRRRTELAGAAGARVGDGEIVHALTTRIWVGLEVPAVLCSAAPDPLRIRPAGGPVTCRRCRARRTGATEGGRVPGQESLWG